MGEFGGALAVYYGEVLSFDEGDAVFLGRICAYFDWDFDGIGVLLFWDDEDFIFLVLCELNYCGLIVVVMNLGVEYLSVYV